MSQEDEARYGFLNAKALSGIEEDKLISWDCGAGSYQICSKESVHYDTFGSGTIHAQSMEGKDFSPNPFSGNDINKLLNYLHRNLKEAPTWLKRTENLPVSIGSSMSIFNQMRVLSGKDQFSAEDVELILERCVDK